MSSPEEPTDRPSSTGSTVEPGRESSASDSPAPGEARPTEQGGPASRPDADPEQSAAATSRGEPGDSTGGPGERSDDAEPRAEGPEPWAEGAENEARGEPEHATGGEGGTGGPRQGGEESDDPVPGVHLEPIPPTGTAAPPDEARVFGRTPSTWAPGPAPGAAGWARTRTTSGPPSSLSEEQLTRLRKRGKLALTLGIASALTLLLLPLGSVAGLLLPAGLVAGVVAVVLGIAVVLKGKRGGARIPGAVPGIVLGTVSTVLIGIIAATLAVFWEEVNDYAECVSGANTLEAQDKCRAELERRLTERLEGMQRAPQQGAPE